MADLTTLYITNWSSKRHHGPGRKLTIMARPRAWEHGDGSVGALMPNPSDLVAVKSGTLTEVEYFARFRAKMLREIGPRPGEINGYINSLAPRYLQITGGQPAGSLVWDGDTLLCACAVGAPCHRREAAPFLVRAGWRVILDGAEVPRG